MTDPIFNRDIGFFLFELPFLRLVQGLFNALVVGALLVTLARYLVSATHGGLVFSTQVRVHLAVLAGLFLLSVAFGYQLDKLDLSYSTRGVATGVSFTDQNAQFIAFDMLTVLSGIAAALLVGGAFTRVLWPLGLTIARLVRRVARHRAAVPGGRPALHRRPEPVRAGVAVHRQQHRDDAARLRRRRLDRPAVRRDGGPHAGQVAPRRRRSPAPGCGIHARCRTASTSSRRCASTTTSPTSTPTATTIDGVQRQVMLSGRELALEQNPSATGWVNQRIVYTHGIGVAMVPVNEVGSQGQPDLFIGNLPPVSTAGAPTITQPRIYFGERPSSYVVVGAQQDEFDYPTGEGDDGGVGRRRRRAGPGTTGIKLDTTLMRLLFAARFRDLDLLISDQVTGRQPAAVPSLA